MRISLLRYFLNEFEMVPLDNIIIIIIIIIMLSFISLYLWIS
jgi:hypothetical protein